MSNATADVLRKAAEGLERNGWHQGSYESGGATCAIGAINKAVSGSAIFTNEVGLSAQIAAERKVGPLAHWNDAPDRRMSDVVKLFNQVADEEDFR